MPGDRTATELVREVLETQEAIDANGHRVETVTRIVVERSRAALGADRVLVELVGRDAIEPSGFTDRCVRGRVPLRCDDTAGPDGVDRAASHGVRSMVAVPLLLPVSRDCIGVLRAVSGEPGHFDDADVELLDAMGDFVATALHRAHDVSGRDDLAVRDTLTGLPKRRVLLDRLAVALARATRSGAAVTVLFVDLDGFNRVNHRFGHDAGDQVLRSVARAVSAAVRPSDTVARLGADQFVVLCEEVDDRHLANLVERLRWASAAAWPGPLPIEATIGIARSVPQDTAEAVLARADLAMHELKQVKAAAR